MRYLTIPAAAFRPSRSDTGYDHAGTITVGDREYRGLTAVDRPDTFTARIPVPNNSDLRFVSARVGVAAGGRLSAYALNGASGALAVRSRQTVTAADQPIVRNLQLSTEVDQLYAWDGMAAYVAVDLAPGNVLIGAQAQYLPLPGEFHPQATDFTPAPVRVYDSRTEKAGAIYPGADRYVPIGSRSTRWKAYAAVLNVTVTNTGSAGWLAVRQAGSLFQGTSTVNWYYAGQTVANTTTVALGTANSGYEGYIALLVGRTEAHVVIDLLGYYAL
jgi:hypothetical protein